MFQKSCFLDPNVLHNICSALQKKVSHTGLERHEAEMMTRVFIFGWTLPLNVIFSEETEMWSHSDLTPCSHPSSVFMLYRGGVGKTTSLPSNLTHIFSLLCTSQSPLSLFLSLDAHTGPCIPATVEQIVSVFHAASKQKAWDHFSKANARTWTCGESKQRLVFSFL